MSKPKLPRAIAQMVEKNNLVLAIKTLAEDEGISMDAAKERIDMYEAEVKAKQQHQLSSIANKQGIPSEAMYFSNDPAPRPPSDQADDNTSKPASPSMSSFQSLHSGLDHHLNNLGYKKPVIPYWLKRVTLILVVMAVIFWILWRVFN